MGEGSLDFNPDNHGLLISASTAKYTSRSISVKAKSVGSVMRYLKVTGGAGSSSHVSKLSKISRAEVKLLEKSDD